jgi:methyl-accepting chemotaxis protein
MRLTVHQRLVTFSSFSMFALAALAYLSMSIVEKAEFATENLIREKMVDVWLLTDLDKSHRDLQDLSYKLKAQLLLWQEVEEQFDVLSTRITRLWQDVEKNPRLSEWAQRNRATHRAVQAYLEALAQDIAARSYYTAGQTVDFELHSAISPMLAAVEQQRLQARKQTDAGATELLQFLIDQQHYLLVGAGIFVLAVTALTYWLRRSVTVRLQRISGQLRAMEQDADLSCQLPVSGKDEITDVARAINGLVARFTHFIADVQDAAQAMEVRSVILDEQAEAVYASSRRTHAQVQELAESTAIIMDRTARIQGAASESRRKVSKAVENNQDVQRQVRRNEQTAERALQLITHTADSLDSLRESSENIEQVVSFIAAIAEQTNLLALNAAIEAARAGTHGRGFAVVADEVRNLSRRTAESTEQIRQWVNDLQVQAHQTHEVLGETRAAGDTNWDTLGVLREHLLTLNTTYADLQQLSDDVDKSILSQREEINRVGQHSDLLRDSSRDLEHSVEQTSAVSVQLRDQASSLRALTASFNT